MRPATGSVAGMSRLGELDLPDRLSPTVTPWVTQLGVGLLCTSSAILIRAIFDALATAGAPFALVFPAVMLATLFARWPAGAVTAVTTIGYSYAYTSRQPGFRFANAGANATLVFIILGTILTIACAELFRRAARRATQERDREIADRDLLLAEIDHRMKNNFALVTSILDIQRRRADGDAADALGSALRRVESIARAHRHLYRGDGQSGTVQMQAYLGDLCSALADALSLRGGITLICDCDEAAVPRDRAVSIGLVANELVTNAAKHAFTGRDSGTIAVCFRARPQGWALIVSDDGVGMNTAAPKPQGNDHGLGSRLIPAFARQAGGVITTASGADGTEVTLELIA